MYTERQREMLLSCFDLRSMEDMWMVLDAKYKALGLSDGMSGDDKIAEYKWVIQQFRKYMTTHMDMIYDAENLESAAANVRQAKQRAEYGDSRQSIVYSFVRDAWLDELEQVIGALMEERDTIYSPYEGDDY